MIYVRGADSEIAKSLAGLCPTKAVPRHFPMPGVIDNGYKSGGYSRYLFCVGMNHQLPIIQQTNAQITETFMVTAVNVIKECDRLLEQNHNARICVVGSESAFTWSFDGAYAAAKAALHCYVETKRLGPLQQLVCVSPTCVINTGMNQRRNADGKQALENRVQKHPKRRWLSPLEVANMIHFLLCVDAGYTTGVVIRMNGGEHCWR